MTTDPDFAAQSMPSATTSRLATGSRPRAAAVRQFALGVGFLASTLVACPPLLAQAPTHVDAGATGLQELLAKFYPQLGMRYSRTLVDERIGDFRHSLGVDLALAFQITPETLVRAGFALDREFGAPIERFELSNAAVGVSRIFILGPVGALIPALFVKLPSNADDRRYLSYRGSLGASLRLSNPAVVRIGTAHALGSSVGVTAARNMFAYNANKEGGLNRLFLLRLSASVSYTLYERLAVEAGFSNTSIWFTADARDNDRYELFGSISYMPTDELRLSLSSRTADRTFDYNQVDWNVKLHRTDKTRIVLGFMYSPRIGS